MKNSFILIFCFFSFFCFSQRTINIALIHDAEVEVGVLKDLQNSVKTEINQLLQYQYKIVFNDYYGNFAPATVLSNIQKAYSENDIIVTLGIISSQIVSLRTEYPKPTIAAIISDSELSGLAKSAEGTTDITNFTYIESPFDVGRDLQILNSIQDFDQLAIVYENETILGGNSILKKVIETNLEGKAVEIQFYNIRELVAGTTSFQEGTSAVYVLPILSANLEEELKLLFQLINDQGLPSTALFGETYIDYGALVAYESDQNLRLIPRRIALNSMKIIEGMDAKDLEVEIETYNDNLLINMATARQIGIYPDFDLIAKATLINLEEQSSERQLNLQTAIAEALSNNLDIKLSALDIEVAKKDIAIAKSDALPQFDISSSLSAVDELTAFSYQGVQGQVNWLGSANFSQVIFSEPLLANIAIQKMLKKGAEYELEQIQLDLIIDAAESYLNILQAQSNLSIQQKNVEVTKENYNISKSKNAIGYTGAADLYRWEAELASKNIELNAALASVRQAKYRLNQLLNRPINEAFSIKNESLEQQVLLVTDGRLEHIDDYGDVEKFTTFIVDFAKDKLPALHLMDNNIDTQKRLALSQSRAFYTPSLAVNGSVNRVLGKYKIPKAFEPTDNATTWNLGLGLSYPIFQGGLRKKQLEQSELQLDQLTLTRKNIQNQLELGIRSNMENIYVAYTRMDLSREAATAASKNFEIVQDAYNQGQANITTLIDAQNNTLQSELNATNAVYSFILDFLNLERSIGFFYFLSSTEERNAFFQEANAYLNR